MQQKEIERRFERLRVDDLKWGNLVRAAGVQEDLIYQLRERIDCGDWKHVADYFLRPSPRRYVTVRPVDVIRAMEEAGIW